MKIRNGISAEQARRFAMHQQLSQGCNPNAVLRQSKAELKAMLEQAAKNTAIQHKDARR